MAGIDTCRKHPHESIEAQCPVCSYGYCSACVVYVQGPNRPPLCIQCALARAGVRSSGAPKRSWTQRRKEGKLRKAATAAYEDAQRAANDDAKAAEPDRLEFDPDLLDRERQSWSKVDEDWKNDED